MYVFACARVCMCACAYASYRYIYANISRTNQERLMCAKIWLRLQCGAGRCVALIMETMHRNSVS